MNISIIHGYFIVFTKLYLYYVTFSRELVVLRKYSRYSFYHLILLKFTGYFV